MDNSIFFSEHKESSYKLNNSVCLILSQKDANHINHHNYHKVSLGLRQIIISLGKSNYIKNISLGIIECNNHTWNKNANSNQLTYFIRALSIRTSDFIEHIDAKLRCYELEENDKFFNDSILYFEEKLTQCITLKQKRKG